MLIAGVDEAGRGPLAGAVFAAAVILDPNRPIAGLKDSKKLTARRREILFDLIQQQALSFAIASASVAEIDQMNILQASLLAMQRAIFNLSIVPDQVKVDGLYCPQTTIPCAAIVQGDSLIESISAASILAKVARDREMTQLAQLYPHYGFEKHSGYPTKSHLEALKRYGNSEIHRKTFAPVKAVIDRLQH